MGAEQVWSADEGDMARKALARPHRTAPHSHMDRSRFNVHSDCMIPVHRAIVADTRWRI